MTPVAWAKMPQSWSTNRALRCVKLFSRPSHKHVYDDHYCSLNHANCSLNHVNCSLNHVNCSLNHLNCSLNHLNCSLGCPSDTYQESYRARPDFKTKELVFDIFRIRVFECMFCPRLGLFHVPDGSIVFPA